MSRFRFVLLLGLVLSVLSCRKDSGSDGREIVIHVDRRFVFETKTDYTDVSGTLYWFITYFGNAAGTSTELSFCPSGYSDDAMSTVVGGDDKIHTDKYQSETEGMSLNYYVSNHTFRTSSGACVMTVADNGTDIVVGRTPQTTSVTPLVQMGHIFSKIGTLTLEVPHTTGPYSSKYAITGPVTWTIEGVSAVNGTAGTYNLRTSQWTATSAALSPPVQIGYVASPSYPEGSAVPYQMNSTGIYLIPGTYQVSVSFSLQKGNFSQNYVRSGNVTLTKGDVNNIKVVTSVDDASEVAFTVEVAGWTSAGTDFNWGP